MRPHDKEARFVRAPHKYTLRMHLSGLTYDANDAFARCMVCMHARIETMTTMTRMYVYDPGF